MVDQHVDLRAVIVLPTEVHDPRVLVEIYGSGMEARTSSGSEKSSNGLVNVFSCAGSSRRRLLPGGAEPGAESSTLTYTSKEMIV